MQAVHTRTLRNGIDSWIQTRQTMPHPHTPSRRSCTRPPVQRWPARFRPWCLSRCQVCRPDLWVRTLV